MIDLHTHSRASDGTDTPTELVTKAAAAGIEILAITDHDTTNGWDEAQAALPSGMTLVTGAEFSCVHTDADGREISLHILGYLFDPEHEALRAERARLRASRLGRGEKIVRNLEAAGYPITWDRVTELAAGAAVGRPHIASVLVENGVVASVGDAFTHLLNPAGPYYAHKADTDVVTAVEMVRAAGGVAVFAHPYARRRGPVVSAQVITSLAAAGLAGLEVDHPDHSPQDRDELRRLAADLDLIVTGSSDYHGTNKTIPLAACTTDPRQYERLLQAAAARTPIRSPR